MICPHCGYKNITGAEKCYLCTAPLGIQGIIKNAPKKVLLSDKKSGNAYFIIALIVIIGFGYTILRCVKIYQKAIDSENESNLTYQALKQRADLANLENN
jgi:hypothetical protein